MKFIQLSILSLVLIFACGAGSIKVAQPGRAIARADTSNSFIDDEDRLNTAKDLTGLENQVKSAQAVIDAALTNLDKIKVKVKTNQGKFCSKDIVEINTKLDGLITLLTNLRTKAQTIRAK